jgi:hypothetical protein
MADTVLGYLSGTTGAAWMLAAGGVVTTMATVVGLIRQRTALVRLDERMAHLTAAVSLLTSTTEEGWRTVSTELARAGAVVPAAVQPEPPPSSLRERIERAAGHGRTVKDIATAEGISEGEVLMHLLLAKLQPEASHAEMC